MRSSSGLPGEGVEGVEVVEVVKVVKVVEVGGGEVEKVEKVKRVEKRALYACVMGLVALVSACAAPPAKDGVEIEPVRVKTALVEYREVAIPVRSTGYVATSEEIKLSFKTGGIVARTLVNEGDRVKKGQLLAELNLSEINAQVAQAQNGYDKAKRDYDRARNLYADSVATLEQLQNAETALNVAMSVLKLATFNQNHSKISAPENGIILKQLTRTNELTGPGYPVYVLGVSKKNWVIKTGLADREVVRIEPGDSASVTIDAWPEETFSAVVSQMDETAQPQTGTFEVELLLNVTDKKLVSGFIANLEIFPAKKERYYLIPVEALTDATDQSAWVYLPGKNQSVSRVEVKIVNLSGDKAIISGGLEGITEVITSGAAYLKDNDIIQIIR